MLCRYVKIKLLYKENNKSYIKIKLNVIILKSYIYVSSYLLAVASHSSLKYFFHHLYIYICMQTAA